MIKSLEISGIQYDTTDATKHYIETRIGRTDRYLPRHARKSASADVKVKKNLNGGKESYEVEVIAGLPDKRAMAKAQADTVLGAVDQAEAKIVSQFKKYKETSLPHVGRRRLFKVPFSRSTAETNDVE